MLSPNDTCHKNDINEADQQKRSATIALSTHHNDLLRVETGTTQETNVGAVTRESSSAITDIPTTLEVAMQRQEETAAQMNERVGNKRKKRKDSATNQSAAMQIRSETNTGFFSAEQHLIQMQLLERQQHLHQQIHALDSHGLLGTNTASALFTQLSRPQEGLHLPSIQRQSLESLVATNRSLRQPLDATSLNQEQRYQLLLQHHLHQQQQQQQQSRWNMDQQLSQSQSQSQLSQYTRRQNEVASAAAANVSPFLNQLNRLHTERITILQQPDWMMYRDQMSAIGIPSIGRNSFLQGQQQPHVELPAMLNLQQSLIFARSAELQQLQLANQRIEQYPMTIGSALLQGQFTGRNDSLSRTMQSGVPWGQIDALSVDALFLPACLAKNEDSEKLSPHQVLLRKQIEAFQATVDDVSTHTRGRNKPIGLNQVGIRCRHCAHLPVSERRKGSTYFPATILGIYQAAQNMSTTHVHSGLCSEMPIELKAQFETLQNLKVASSGAGRPYWSESAKQLGLVDTEDGIQFIRSLRRGTRILIDSENKIDDTR